MVVSISTLIHPQLSNLLCLFHLLSEHHQALFFWELSNTELTHIIMGKIFYVYDSPVVKYDNQDSTCFKNVKPFTWPRKVFMENLYKTWKCLLKVTVTAA